MNSVAILGAGELGASLARVLADREQVRRVVLVDPDEGRARGKALDLRQAGPVGGSDTVVEGCVRLDGLGELDAVVVADPAELAGPEVTSLRIAEFMRGLRPHLGDGPLVVAASAPGPLVAAAGVAADRVLGSAPIAWSAALRRLLASELRLEPSSVTGSVLGAPPDFVPIGVSVAGAPLDPTGLAALGRVTARLVGQAFGPVSLAAAAARALRALSGARESVLPLVVAGATPGARPVALPVRVAAGRIRGEIALELSPRERLALDNARERGR